MRLGSLARLSLCLAGAACACGARPERVTAPVAATATEPALAPAPERPSDEGVVPLAGQLGCDLEQGEPPPEIPAEERVEGVRADVVEGTLVKVGCPGEAPCCMAPAGDRGGQFVTYLDRFVPSAPRALPRVALVQASRVVGSPGSEVLEHRLLWVDAATLGVRLARSCATPLTPVGRPAGITQVYAFRDAEALIAVVPTRGHVWGYVDEPTRSEREAATSCDFMTFLLPPAGREWSAPLLMLGPTSSFDDELLPYRGQRVRIELQARQREPGVWVVRAQSRAW